MKETKQRFLKGINKRVNIESNVDPDRLFTLKNARLQSRGETSDISRIKGSKLIENDITQISVDSITNAQVDGQVADGSIEVTSITDSTEPATKSTGSITIQDADPNTVCDIGSPLPQPDANYVYNNKAYVFYGNIVYQYDLITETWDNGTELNFNLGTQRVFSSNLHGSYIYLYSYDVGSTALLRIDLTDYNIINTGVSGIGNLVTGDFTGSLWYYNNKLYVIVSTSQGYGVLESNGVTPNSISFSYIKDPSNSEFIDQLPHPNYCKVAVDSVNALAYFISDNGIIIELDFINGTENFVATFSIDNDLRYASLIYNNGNLYIYNYVDDSGLVISYLGVYEIATNTLTELTNNNSSTKIRPILYNNDLYLLNNSNRSGTDYDYYDRYDIDTDTYLTSSTPEKNYWFNGVNPSFKFNVDVEDLDSFNVTANRCDTTQTLANEIKTTFDNQTGVNAQNQYYTTTVQQNPTSGYWEVIYESIGTGTSENRTLSVNELTPYSTNIFTITSRPTTNTNITVELLDQFGGIIETKSISVGTGDNIQSLADKIANETDGWFSSIEPNGLGQYSGFAAGTIVYYGSVLNIDVGTSGISYTADAFGGAEQHTLPTHTVTGISGGTDEVNPQESLELTITNSSSVVIYQETFNYDTTETLNNVATTISQSLNVALDTEYTVNVIDNVITLTAINDGEEYNATITYTATYTTLTNSNISGGVTPASPTEEIDINVSDGSIIPVSYQTTVSVEDIALLIKQALSGSYQADASGSNVSIGSDETFTITGQQYTTFSINQINTGTDFFNDIVEIGAYQNYIIIIDRSVVSGNAVFTFYSYDIDLDILITIGSFTSNNPDYVNNSVSDYQIITIRDTILCKPFNKQLNLIDGIWVLNDFVSTYPTIDNINTSVGGFLEQVEDYLYAVRYVYFDGHITIKSSPIHIKTTSTNRTVTFDVELDEDLDGNYPKLEVYRKRGSENFFLIEEVNLDNTTHPIVNGVLNYEDSGRSKLGGLEEENYIWSKEHLAHDIVRDRYVKGGLTFENIENNTEFDAQLSTETVADGEYGLPYNSTIEIYNRVIKEDGTNTGFNLDKTLDVDDQDNKLQLKQTTLYDGETKEIESFVKFNAKESQDVIPFGSLEIYNSNVPSIETSGLSEVDQDKPVNPHVFLSWKYLAANGTTEADPNIYDEHWDTNPDDSRASDDFFTSQSLDLAITDFTNNNLWFSNIQSSDGSTQMLHALPYTKYYYVNRAIETDPDSVVYRLAFYDALKEAISAGKLKIRLKSTTVNSLSSSVANDDFVGQEAKVIALYDTSIGEDQIKPDIVDGLSFPTGKNHLYLVLESGTLFDEFDNNLANNKNVKGDYDSGYNPNLECPYEFELIGVNYRGDTFATNPTVDNQTATYDFGLKLTDYTDVELEPMVYVNTKNNSLDNFFIESQIQGWEKRFNNKFEYYTLSDWNIYEQLVKLDDLKTEFPNQIIWSSPIVEGSRFNGTRNFSPENYYNLSSDYGKIVDLRYVGNKLLTFCENGLSMVNVGEVLTSQSSGQTYIDSSRFLSGDYWILTNLVDVKPKSIKKYENRLFFGDGVDVWMFQDGLKNISDGRIELNENNEWYSTLDIKNKEYRVTDGEDTYAYSIELDEWSQFTHYDKSSVSVNNRCFASKDSSFYEHNIGNTFNGTEYPTVIESRANDMNESSVVKLFRKLYIEAKNAGTAILNYGTEYSNMEQKNFSDVKSKNGMYHFGIKRNNNNGTKLFWGVESSEEDFVMRMLSILFSPRKRK